MTPAIWVYLSVGCLLGTMVLLALGAGWRSRRFLAETPRLERAEDLARFKRVVALDMYSALALIVVTIANAGVLAAAFWNEWADWFDLALLVGFCAAVLIVMSVWTSLGEKPLRRIEAADHLRGERDRIVAVWLKKMLPDW